MTEGKAPAVVWWIEFEHGGHSIAYASEAEAWAALMDFQSSQSPAGLLQPRPVSLISSDGLRFAIPTKS
jgi:hypothetical protein